jgi:hypothetical protein
VLFCSASQTLIRYPSTPYAVHALHFHLIRLQSVCWLHPARSGTNSMGPQTLIQVMRASEHSPLRKSPATCRPSRTASAIQILKGPLTAWQSLKVGALGLRLGGAMQVDRLVASAPKLEKLHVEVAGYASHEDADEHGCWLPPAYCPHY